MTIGENGIISRTMDARDKTIIADEQEAITLAYTARKMDDYTKNVTASELQDELEKAKSNINVTTSGEYLIVWYKDTNHRYTVNQNGEIERVDDMTPELAKKPINAENMGGTMLVELMDGTVGIAELNSNTAPYLEKIDVNELQIVSNSGIKQSFFCGYVDNKGKVYTFGRNDDGQLGDGTGIDRYVPKCISDIEENILNGKKIVSVAVNRYGGTVYTLGEDGKIYAWGYNGKGNVGDGTVEDKLEPVCISNIVESPLYNIKIKKIFNTGSYRASMYALDESGKVYAWGENELGQLGDGTKEDKHIPVCISDNSILKGKNIEEIIVDGTLKCVYAIDSDGKVYIWGKNFYGNLNNGNTKPICISDIQDNAFQGRRITKIVTGENYNTTMEYAIDENGKLYVWGDGVIGDGVNNKSDIPICISDIEDNILYGKRIEEVYFSNGNTFAISEDNKLYAWGYNRYGDIGDGSIDNKLEPICISEIEENELFHKKIAKITFDGSGTIFALDEEGKVYAWGLNRYGELGDGTKEAKQKPICLNNIEENLLYNKKVINMDSTLSYILSDGKIVYMSYDVGPM